MPRTQSLESTLAWQVHLQPCWTTYPCDRLRGRDWKRHDWKTNQRVKWNKIFENLNSGLRITHVRNSMSRINPCLWKCICNHVGGPTLVIYWEGKVGKSMTDDIERKVEVPRNPMTCIRYTKPPCWLNPIQLWCCNANTWKGKGYINGSKDSKELGEVYFNMGNKTWK